LRLDTKGCLVALALAGFSVAGCEAVQSDYSSPFKYSTEGRSSDDLLRGSFENTQGVIRAETLSEGDQVLLADIRPSIHDPASPLQCVPFARDASGIAIRGNANRWWQLAAGKYTRSRRPEEGAVLVMRGYNTSRRGHVAVVRQILNDRTIVVDHANWGNDGRIYLSAPVRDESPKNDWSQVRVWYTPAGQWGKRVYKAKGFIHPTQALASISSLAGSN
jgi:hypothetical protein